MPDTLTPDICIIGAGAGGLSVAAAAAVFGVPVVLIERAAPGGTGLSLASKSLVAAASRAAAASQSRAFGVEPSRVDIDFAALHRHVQNAIRATAVPHSAERYAALGVRVIKGEARFKDRRTVAVGEEFEIRARRFVIATGSELAVPEIAGHDNGPYFTAETIFGLEELPTRLIVVGASPAGLELAQAFRRLGSDVTVLAAEDPLTGTDPEAAAVVLAQIEREGVSIRTGARPIQVSHVARSVAVTFDIAGRQEVAEGSHLLFAGDRGPATEGLGLDAAGIKHDAAGIKVNRRLKTSNSRVYAVGDVAAGQARSVQAAHYQAGLVVRNALFRSSARVDEGSVPSIVCTEPELAQAGLTEAQARQRRLKFRILRWPYHDNDRAQAERRTHGHIKALIDRKGRILGATIVGAQAGELIALWSLAIAQGVNIRALAGVVLPYPTFSEIGPRMAIDFFVPNLTRPWVQRIIAWLRIFG